VDVYVYWGGPDHRRTGTFTPSYSLNGKTFTVRYDNPSRGASDWGGALRPADATSAADARPGPNTMIFRDVDAETITLTVRRDGPQRYGVAGVQLVSATGGDATGQTPPRIVLWREAEAGGRRDQHAGPGS
jgi:hypothetical protein